MKEDEDKRKDAEKAWAESEVRHAEVEAAKAGVRLAEAKAIDSKARFDEAEAAVDKAWAARDEEAWNKTKLSDTALNEREGGRKDPASAAADEAENEQAEAARVWAKANLDLGWAKTRLAEAEAKKNNAEG